jgi:2-polyprenyl-6-methoxyphenol hydroxylase-like FAD-dependent oxidoreductase
MEAVEQALQAYTAERSRRMLPIGIRSYAIGSLLQNDINLFCSARNWLLPKVVNVEGFVNHTFYDCGSLA